MNYGEVLDYLYHSLPMFQRVGGAAYKKDLGNTIRLCEYLGNPESKFRSVHVAGTNGKGSSSHFIASILQEAGLKVGLYTSPHLKSFTERIRIDGKEADPDFITGFVNDHKSFIEELHPSFFEITVGMAFDYFAREQVDIAVIEVGMGGRLDSTNVIMPEVSLITNISPDHQQWLGNTLEEIAGEKAGIIKKGVPVVVGEDQPEIIHVFEEKAKNMHSMLIKAYYSYKVNPSKEIWTIENDQKSLRFRNAFMPDYQQKNLPGVLAVAEVLRAKGFELSDENITAGLENMRENTGLKGRWDILSEKPLVVCDVGHNVAGMSYVVDQLQRMTFKTLHMVLGMVADKDVLPVLRLLPAAANYYFCEAKIPRAMKAEQLAEKAMEAGLEGIVIHDVNNALQKAREKATEEDLIFIGGSNFIVAELNEL